MAGSQSSMLTHCGAIADRKSCLIGRDERARCTQSSASDGFFFFRPDCSTIPCGRSAYDPKRWADQLTTTRGPILVINAGSSSVKFSVFQTGACRSLTADTHGQVEGIGTSPRLKIADARGRSVADQAVAGNDH